MSTRDDNQAPFDWAPPVAYDTPRATPPAPSTPIPKELSPVWTAAMVAAGGGVESAAAPLVATGTSIGTDEAFWHEVMMLRRKKTEDEWQQRVNSHLIPFLDAKIAAARSRGVGEVSSKGELLLRIQGALDLLADASLPQDTWRDVSNVLHACRDVVKAIGASTPAPAGAAR